MVSLKTRALLAFLFTVVTATAVPDSILLDLESRYQDGNISGDKLNRVVIVRNSLHLPSQALTELTSLLFIAPSHAATPPKRTEKVIKPIKKVSPRKKVKITRPQPKRRTTHRPNQVQLAELRGVDREEPLLGRMRTFSDPDRPPPLEMVTLSYDGRTAFSDELPSMRSRFSGRIAGVTDRNEFVYYTFDPQLQDYVDSIVKKSRDNHLAIVAMEPLTGRVLAIAGRSKTIENPAFHNQYPAASLFKVVTAAAAIEHASITPEHLVRFRGGDYTLEKYNFRADPGRDNRRMTIGEAMGRSVNPVFGRIALEALTPRILSATARDFGFNGDLNADLPVPQSHAFIPHDDFLLARTGAGFGEVTISPVHAASMVSGIANGGNLLRPIFIDKVLSPTGALRYRSRPTIMNRMISRHAANSVFDMMENTTSIGTGRRAFMERGRPVFPDIRIAAKTGTLTGTNPAGLTRWFIAVAPRERPRIAIAIVAVHPGRPSGNPSFIGRQVLGRYFGS